MGRPKPAPPSPPTPFEATASLLAWSRETSTADYFGFPHFLAELSLFEAALLVFLVSFICGLKVYASMVPMKKKAVLNLHALNRANVFKECFLGYVNAAMIEPILAISSADYDASLRPLYLNVLQLLGLFSWLYLLWDAFDIADTQQAYVYWVRVRKCGEVKSLPAWFKNARATAEADEVRGSAMRDVSLWFMVACSMLACCGLVSHRDVMHSHTVVLLWLVLHHLTRNATAWRGTGYWHTLFSPSAALLPLEYCLVLIDQDMISDEAGLEDIATIRQFIKDQSGVELTIIA